VLSFLCFRRSSAWCDGGPNVLTVILDANGTIIGGLTSLHKESRGPNRLLDVSN
jgi:hypothetical protein